MKAMSVMCSDGKTAVTVKMGTKHRGWAWFLDVKSQLPVFVYVGQGWRTIKRRLIDFIKEGMDDTADGNRWQKIAERLLNREDLEVFGDDCEGQTTYFNGLMLVCLKPFASQHTVVHECVHLSQFLLRYKYGNSDVSCNDVLELQSEIVENFCAPIWTIMKRLMARTKRR